MWECSQNQLVTGFSYTASIQKQSFHSNARFMILRIMCKGLHNSSQKGMRERDPNNMHLRIIEYSACKHSYQLWAKIIKVRSVMTWLASYTVGAFNPVHFQNSMYVCDVVTIPVCIYL